MLRASFVVVAILFMAQAAPSAFAQRNRDDADVDTPTLVVEATAGWEGTVDRMMPVPVSFLLSNFSNTVIEGRLVLRDPWNGTEADLGEIYLSEGATRSFSSVQGPEDWSSCLAEFRSGNRVLWRRELPLTTGLEFDTSKNFALVINDSSRKPSFPELPAEVERRVLSSQEIAAESGRPVQYLQAKSWQIPVHHAPLTAVQAMIFPEDTPLQDINQGQWRAIAEWVCMGGAVFAHEDSNDVIQQLTNSTPLSAEPILQQKHFAVRRMGLGSIHQYTGQLFRDDGAATRQQIADTIARLSRNHITTLVASGHTTSYRRDQGRAVRNRFLVVGFFCLYTLFSGLVVLAMFRQPRRRIAAYTIGIVVVASVAAGSLGGMLRMSSGDVNVFSVTQAGAGGVVQMAKLTAESAGGRNTKMAITGNRPDLQFTGRVQQYHYRWSPASPGFPAFTWQPNLVRDLENTYQINVPMTPWGRRQLYATGFDPQLRPMDITIEFQPNPLAVELPKTEIAIPVGTIEVTIVNHLPFRVSDCTLVLGFARPAPSEEASVQETNSYQVDRFGNLIQQSQAGSPVPFEFYHTLPIANLEAGAEYRHSSAASFRLYQNDRSRISTWYAGQMTLPAVSREGNLEARLVGRIDTSQSLNVDETRSDFVPRDELHVFVQEVPPEDLPDSLKAQL